MQTALQSRDSDAASRPPPADIGDESWSKMLAKCPSWSPEGEALLVVAPHPNDETLGAGGLIRTWAALGRQVNVLSVSDGEAAEPRLEGLGNVRREEMREALRKLCPTHVSVTRLGLPDGRIAEHLNRLRNAMLSLCRDKVTLIAPCSSARGSSPQVPAHQANGEMDSMLYVADPAPPSPADAPRDRSS